MKMFKSKKGVSENQIDRTILLIVGIVVIFELLESFASTLIGSANNLSASGLPLATLFSGDGVLLLIIMAVIFMQIFKSARKK